MELATASAPTVELIPLERIQANRNLRETLPDVDQLAESIRRHGMLTAILVDRLPDGGYELVAGFRRHAAAILAGLGTVPAVVRDPVQEPARIASQLAENVDRIDLSDLEQAQAMQQMLDLGSSPEDVAASIGATSKAVDAWTAVLRLPRKAQRLVADGTISMTDAVRLTAIADSKEDLAEALTSISHGDRVQRVVDDIVRRREIEAKRTASLARLEAEGCTVVDAPRWDHLPAGSKTQRLGKGHGCVPVSVAAHRKLGCHAAFVSREGEVVYVCTDRNAHAPKPDAQAVEDRKAVATAARAERKALRHAHAARREALATALRNGAFNAEEAQRHVLTSVVWDADPRDMETESVAYIVMSALKIDSSQYSFGYLASWGAGPEEIRRSGHRIQPAAQAVLEALA